VKGDIVKRVTLIGLFGVALVMAPMVSAQDVAPMFSVLTVHTQLGSQAAYEAGLAEIWKAFKTAGLGAPIFVRTSVENPGTYTFAVPVASWAEFGEVSAKAQAGYASIPAAMQKIDATQTSTRQEMWITREDLWYRPAKPRLQDGEVGFTRVAFVYPHPAKALAFEAALKEFVATRKKHGLASGTEVYELAMGSEGPAYGIIVGGKDQADFIAQNAKELAAMGADWQAYLDKVGPYVRRVEFESYLERSDLYFTP
jgi:hypothetical protein